MLILTVSYDSESLNRQLRELEVAGHVIVPSSSLETCLNAIVMGTYQVLVIGITVPVVDRERIADASRKIRSEAFIISIQRLDAPDLESADYRIEADDEHRLNSNHRQTAQKSIEADVDLARTPREDSAPHPCLRGKKYCFN